MPHPPHSVKVETKVVDGVQDLRQQFVGCIKMTQVGPGVALADATGAIGIKWIGILSIAGLLDRNFSFGSEKQAVTRGAGGQDAIHHVDAKICILDNLFGCADSHQVARLVFGKMLQRGFDDFAGEFAGLAYAEASDGISGKSDLDGALGGFFAEVAVHAALDYAEEGLGGDG